MEHYVSLILQGFEEPLEPGRERELAIDMDAVLDQDPALPRPEFYYAAESQQTRFNCDKCGDFNDVRGVFSYCASCGWRNNFAFLKASLSSIRNKLNEGHIGPIDALKSAISEFDSSCRDIAKQLVKRCPMKLSRSAELERASFHDIDSKGFELLKSMFDIDLLRGLSDKRQFINMMMQRRHVFEHGAGVADERYISQSGDESALEGVLIRENQGNVHELIGCVNKMAANMDTDFHEVFQPTTWPIDYYRRRNATE